MTKLETALPYCGEGGLCLLKSRIISLTRNALPFFDSIANGWIDYSHNHALVKLFSLALNATEQGRATDNAFIERLWRSLKYECIHLHAPEDGHQLRKLLNKYFNDYNNRRPHISLGGLTPAHVYLGLPDQRRTIRHINSITEPR